MQKIMIQTCCLSKDQISEKLEQQGIRTNLYAQQFFSHPRFSAEYAGKITLLIVSLREIGFENGASLPEIYQKLPQAGLKPCPPQTGLFLRLAWRDQPESENAILTGTHEVPDQAVTVLSELLEENDDFPKGLYLRNVEGILWLRGYVCESQYCFPADAVFAFETVEQND